MDADRIGADGHIDATDRPDLALAHGAQAGGGGGIRIGRGMFAGDDQPALIVVIKVGVEFADTKACPRAV